MSGERLRGHSAKIACSTYLYQLVKLNILTCSEDVWEEGVEWEIPLVDVAEGAAAVWEEGANVG